MSIHSINGSSLNAAYDKTGTSLSIAYDKDENEVWRSGSSGPSHLVSNSFTATLLYDIIDIESGTQGLACDSLSQTIAQLYTGKIITIDLSDGSYTQRASARNLGHGSAGQFEPEKRNSEDLYPALWISTGQAQTINDIRYARFLEVFIGQSQSTINRVFYVPATGYNLFAFDFENRLIYMCGLINSDGASYMRVYDMDDYSAFPDGAYAQTPANGHYILGDYLAEYSMDYIEGPVQSVSFFDGLVAFLSDAVGVVFWDVATHDVFLTINSGIVPYEREGIDFIKNPSTGQTDMVLSARQNTSANAFNVYYRYEFNV